MFVDITQQCFALLPQVNFPTNNFLTEGKGDGIKSRLSSEIFSTLLICYILIAGQKASDKIQAGLCLHIQYGMICYSHFSVTPLTIRSSDYMVLFSPLRISFEDKRMAIIRRIKMLELSELKWEQ